MNISVYFYDEEGKYTHMDMVHLEFDSDGVQILPENSTTEYPPDLSTEPLFDVVSGKWYSQVPKMPYTSDDFLKEVRELRAEIEALKNTPVGLPEESAKKIAHSRKHIDLLVSDLYDLRYNLRIMFPQYTHMIGEDRGKKYN